MDVQEANEEEANEEIEDGMSGNNGCCNNVSTTSRGSSRSFKKVAGKTAGRLGLDFGVYALKLISRRWQSNGDDNKIDSMSSTGFVTFLDLGTVTSVASTPLTHKPKVCMHIHVNKWFCYVCNMFINPKLNYYFFTLSYSDFNC